MDSSDQIQIRICDFHNLCVFWGKDLEKEFLTSGMVHNRCRTCSDILPEPMLVAPRLSAISYISFHVFHLLHLCTVFKLLVVMFYSHLRSVWTKVHSIREKFVFQTEIHTFRIFIRSLCCFSFLSSPPSISLLFFSVPCFFNSTEHEDMPLSW